MSSRKLKLKFKKTKRTNRFSSRNEPSLNVKKAKASTATMNADLYGFESPEDSVFHELLGVVQLGGLSEKPTKMDKEVRESQVKENLRYQAQESTDSHVSIPFTPIATPKRPTSLPPKRTKEDLIKLLNQEKLKVPAVEQENKRERKKSLIVITEKFFNTKGSKPLIPEDKIHNDVQKRVSEISTADCKSAQRRENANPYEDNSYLKRRCRSSKPTVNSYLDNLDDMTPQKLDFSSKSPGSTLKGSEEKVTPAKRSKSTLKVNFSEHKMTLSSSKCRTPKIVIPKRKLSSGRVSRTFIYFMNFSYQSSEIFLNSIFDS